MPPEYCSFGPDFESHCSPWLMKNHPQIYDRLYAKKSTAESGEGGDSDNDAPTGPWTTEERLVAFYTKYMPEKLDNVPALLEKYEGMLYAFF